MENEIKKHSFIEKATNGLSRAGAFMGQQKHFSAIRDAFGAFLPLLIVGALAVMINSVFIQSGGLLATLCGAEEGNALYESWSTASTYISPLFDGINNATMNLFSVYIAFLLGFFLMGSYGGNQLMGGLIGLAAFMLLAPMEASAGFTDGIWNGGVGTGYLGAKGIIFAMLTGLTAPMLLWKLQNVRQLKINMPEGVPPVVGNSLNSLFPFIITVLTFGAIQPIWHAIMLGSGISTITMGETLYNAEFIIEAFYAGLVSPFMSLSQSLPAVILILILISMFWFFGVHGSNVMAPVVNALWTPAIVANVATLNSFGGDINAAINSGDLFIWTEQTMNSFVFLGGSSAVIGLLIGISIFSKLPEQRAISSIATPIACFNISEPVMFGLPVVLNPVYFLPFLFGSAILGTISYVFTVIGLVNPTVVLVPWTAPVFLSGFMSTLDWRSLLLTAINLAVAIFIYIPFILLDIKQQTKQKAAEANMSVEEFRVMAETQMQEEKLERKSTKEVSKLNFKIELLEKDVEYLEDKAESIQYKLEDKLDKIEESKGFAEHNQQVYTNLGNTKKANKEKAKLEKVDSKVKTTTKKFEDKIKASKDSKAKVEKEIEKLQSQIPTAQANADKKLEAEKAKLEKKASIKKAKAEAKANKKGTKINKNDSSDEVNETEEK